MPKYPAIELKPMSEYPHGVDESEVVVFHTWMGRIEQAICKYAAYDTKACGWLWRKDHPEYKLPEFPTFSCSSEKQNTKPR